MGFNGALCALKGKITKSTVHYSVKRDDCKHSFELRIPSSDADTYRQIFLNQEYDFDVKTQPKAIVDAGANIGLASIYFANRYPDAKIIAIEPELSNFELLRKNVAPYPNVIPVHAALWDKNEEINLVDPGLGNWGFMTEKENADGGSAGQMCHKVAAMTVEAVMSRFDLAWIDILKIDIEGAEKEVFLDPSAWIDKVGAIIIELHERMKPGCNRSFYNGSSGFDAEWLQGENIYLSKNGTLIRRTR